MATKTQVVVGMPAFTDPNNDAAAAGSVNFPLDEHPVTHAKDYGRDYQRQLASLNDDTTDTPDDRADWKKADWKNQAEAYDLPVSGNMDELKKRVEDYEAEQATAEGASDGNGDES